MSEKLNTQPNSRVDDPELAHEMANVMAPDMDEALFHKREAEIVQAETDQLREEMAEHDPYAQSGGHLDQEWVGDAEAESHRVNAEFHERAANEEAEELREDREMEARAEVDKALDEDRELAAH